MFAPFRQPSVEPLTPGPSPLAGERGGCCHLAIAAVAGFAAQTCFAAGAAAGAGTTGVTGTTGSDAFAGFAEADFAAVAGGGRGGDRDGAQRCEQSGQSKGRQSAENSKLFHGKTPNGNQSKGKNASVCFDRTG